MNPQQIEIGKQIARVAPKLQQALEKLFHAEAQLEHQVDELLALLPPRTKLPLRAGKYVLDRWPEEPGRCVHCDWSDIPHIDDDGIPVVAPFIYYDGERKRDDRARKFPVSRWSVRL
jgi:hypothetical protein